MKHDRRGAIVAASGPAVSRSKEANSNKVNAGQIVWRSSLNVTSAANFGRSRDRGKDFSPTLAVQLMSSMDADNRDLNESGTGI